MNKQEMNLLNDVRLLIEERNALRADKEALIDALRISVDGCSNCKNDYDRPCYTQEGYLDCTTCTYPCACRECKAGSHFEWIGRSEKGKHAAPEHPLPVGVQMAIEQDKARKRGKDDGRK